MAFFAANQLYLFVFANEDGKEKKKHNVIVIGSGSHANQILPKDVTAAKLWWEILFPGNEELWSSKRPATCKPHCEVLLVLLVGL